MKLHKLNLLLLITIIFAVFVVGLFAGRLTGDHTLWTNNASNSSTQESDETKETSSIINGRLNINTATADDFVLLPGIGEVLAERIVEYRRKNGLFASVDDLMNVKGLGQSKLEEIKKYITIGG